MSSTEHATASTVSGSAQTSSPAAYASSARIRLPPPSTAYRIASCRARGASVACGKTTSRATSTRRARSPAQTSHATSGFIVARGRVATAGREYLEYAAFENLHLLLRVLERGLAILQ